MSIFYLNIKFSPGCTCNLKAITSLSNFGAIVKSNMNIIVPRGGWSALLYLKHQTDQIKIMVVGVPYEITDIH